MKKETEHQINPTILNELCKDYLGTLSTFFEEMKNESFMRMSNDLEICAENLSIRKQQEGDISSYEKIKRFLRENTVCITDIVMFLPGITRLIMSSRKAIMETGQTFG
jgi:hypothetical protein